ncbi:MAG: GAF and ANTAR domain-containing protein [Microthrixaceae bacterium]
MPAPSDQGQPGDPADGLARSLYRIAELLVTDRSLAADLQAAAELAVNTIDGCDACTVSVIVEGRPTTAAATDRVVVQMDLVQYEYDQGPCLDSARTGEVVSVEFVPSDERYPHLASAAHVAEFTAVVSVPVLLEGAEASVNLYSRARGGFTDDPSVAGRVVAAQVALALQRSSLLGEAGQLADELQQEGDRRTRIGQAQGMLAALYHCSMEQAQSLMDQASQDEGRSADEVARTILSTIENPSEDDEAT